MPELIEVEVYRQHALPVLGRRITRVDAPDAWFLKRTLTADTAAAMLAGRRLIDARRIGKLLLFDTDTGPTIGVRFGMTGRLLVDEQAPIQELEYGPKRHDAGWDRFRLAFAEGGSLIVNDPRRLGGVELDPDEGRMGIDAWSITPRQLDRALGTSEAPLKARLMDQTRIAGLGNLLVDETLWRAGLDPARAAGSLAPDERKRLQRHIRRTIGLLWRRGGSHTGDLQIARIRGGLCPRDGTPLERRTVGGRTTYSCPQHQS